MFGLPAIAMLLAAGFAALVYATRKSVEEKEITPEEGDRREKIVEAAKDATIAGDPTRMTQVADLLQPFAPEAAKAMRENSKEIEKKPEEVSPAGPTEPVAASEPKNPAPLDKPPAPAKPKTHKEVAAPPVPVPTALRSPEDVAKEVATTDDPFKLLDQSKELDRRGLHEAAKEARAKATTPLDDEGKARIAAQEQVKIADSPEGKDMPLEEQRVRAHAKAESIAAARSSDSVKQKAIDLGSFSVSPPVAETKKIVADEKKAKDDAKKALNMVANAKANQERWEKERADKATKEAGAKAKLAADKAAKDAVAKAKDAQKASEKKIVELVAKSRKSKDVKELGELASALDAAGKPDAAKAAREKAKDLLGKAEKVKQEKEKAAAKAKQKEVVKGLEKQLDKETDSKVLLKLADTFLMYGEKKLSNKALDKYNAIEKKVAKPAVPSKDKERKEMEAKAISKKKDEKHLAVHAEKGSRGQVTANVQAKLISLGYLKKLSEKDLGTYGPATVNAITAFQKAEEKKGHLKDGYVVGKLDENTEALLTVRAPSVNAPEKKLGGTKVAKAPESPDAKKQKETDAKVTKQIKLADTLNGEAGKALKKADPKKLHTISKTLKSVADELAKLKADGHARRVRTDAESFDELASEIEKASASKKKEDDNKKAKWTKDADSLYTEANSLAKKAKGEKDSRALRKLAESLATIVKKFDALATESGDSKIVDQFTNVTLALGSLRKRADDIDAGVVADVSKSAPKAKSSGEGLVSSPFPGVSDERWTEFARTHGETGAAVDALIASPLDNATDAAWTEFVKANVVGKSGSISPSFRLGMFGFGARRLGDLGAMLNVRKGMYRGRRVWTGNWAKSASGFLTDPKLQYFLFVEDAGRRIGFILAHPEWVGTEIEGRKATLSGLAAVARVTGDAGLAKWITFPAERYDETKAIYTKANGIF
jgi:peptidoglycan hydrolase-like protein with peptidoglycan-binding domain